MRAEWLDLPVAREVVAELAAGLAGRYRVDAATARREVERFVSARPDLAKVIAGAATAREVRRLRVFKDAEKALRKELYYDLRRYHGDGGSLGAIARGLPGAGVDGQRLAELTEAALAAHASTRERLPHRERFAAILAEWCAGAHTFLDAGCGIAPMLLLPLDPWKQAASYVALDRDAGAIECLKGWGDAVGCRHLRAVQWSVENGWPPVDFVDVALLLKLVPVVHRQQREHLALLASVPARRVIVSGSREALAKRGSIERRERAVLLSFAEDHGLHVAAEDSTPDELLLLMERRTP